MSQQGHRSTQLMLVIGGSLVLTIAVVVGIVLLFRAASEPVDVRTAASNTQALARIEWPANLPPVFVPEQPDGDAAEAYRQVFEYVDEHQRELKNSNVTSPEAEELAKLLIGAMNAGQIKHGFLDEQTPLLPIAKPPFGLGMQKATEVVAFYAADLLEKKQTAQALVSSQAIWALGRRAFMDNVRFPVRLRGLEIMEAAAPMILLCDPQSSVQQWTPYISRTLEVWKKQKSGTVFAVEPNVADVIAIAQEDKDPTWRFEATLKLGSLKYFWGPKIGNKKLIDRALSQAAGDPDPLIAKAGAAALAITREQHLRQQ